MKKQLSKSKIEVNFKARYVLMNIINCCLCLMILCWLFIGLSGIIVKAQQTWHLIGGTFFIIHIGSNCIVIGCFIALLVNCKTMCNSISFKVKWFIINYSVYVPVMICLHCGVALWNMILSNRIWILAVIGAVHVLFLSYVLTTNILMTIKTRDFISLSVNSGKKHRNR